MFFSFERTLMVKLNVIKRMVGKRAENRRNEDGNILQYCYFKNSNAWYMKARKLRNSKRTKRKKKRVIPFLCCRQSVPLTANICLFSFKHLRGFKYYKFSLINVIIIAFWSPMCVTLVDRSYEQYIWIQVF